MLMVAEIKKNKIIEMNEDQKKLFGIEKLNVKRSEIPAVTHVNNSARIQTVHKNTNFRFYSLIKAFKDLTNCPVLCNTSFNIIINSLEALNNKKFHFHFFTFNEYLPTSVTNSALPYLFIVVKAKSVAPADIS